MPTDNTIQWDIMLRTGLLPVFAISYTNLTRETENTAIYWKAQVLAPLTVVPTRFQELNQKLRNGTSKKKKKKHSQQWGNTTLINLLAD